MRQATAWLALSIAVLGAGTGHAESQQAGLTDVFVRFCGETRGDAESALQRADGDEWSELPKSLTVPLIPMGPPVQWVARQGRWTRVQGVRRVLMVGTIRDPDGKDTLMCTVVEVIPRGMKADFAAMQGALRSWVGGGPHRARDGFAEFAYREVKGERTPAPPSEDPFENDAARAPPDAALITMTSFLGMASISYSRTRAP